MIYMTRYDTRHDIAESSIERGCEDTVIFRGEEERGGRRGICDTLSYIMIIRPIFILDTLQRQKISKT